MSSFELVVVADPEALATVAAQRVVAAIEGKERFRLALAGGSTPERLYAKLAADARIDWSVVELFWGDERLVAADHEHSNYRMVRRALLDHVEIPAENVHRIQGELPPTEAAEAYQRVLGATPLDMVLLGMGGDGHTASLFPGQTDGRGVVVTESPVPPTGRVSLALDVINASREAMFLVAGSGKAERLAQVYAQLQDESQIQGEPRLPAAMVRPQRLSWLVDEAAAEKLPRGGGE